MLRLFRHYWVDNIVYPILSVSLHEIIYKNTFYGVVYRDHAITFIIHF